MTALDAFIAPVRSWFVTTFEWTTAGQEKGWPPIQAGRLATEDRRKLKPILALLRADPVGFVRQSASEVPED